MFINNGAFLTTLYLSGSSHGHSRIIRTAYYEDPRYVPLLKRSMELWKILQASNVDEPLLRLVGGLMLGKRDSHVIRGTLRSVQEHSLVHEVLNSDEIRARYGVFNVENDDIGIFEHDAGYLIPENCIKAYLHLAREHGAHLLFNTKMKRWYSHDNKDLLCVEANDKVYW